MSSHEIVTIAADNTPADARIKAAMAQAKAEGFQPVVFVSASWCEPCVRFKKAVKAGKLKDKIRGARFLEFDNDKEKRALEAAGYRSRLLPLFAIPGDDGRASFRKIQGGVKGEKAVSDLTTRLSAFLSQERSL